MADKHSGVDTPDEQAEGVLGLNQKLGLGKGTKKKISKPPMLGYMNLPQLPNMVMEQRKREEELPPQDLKGSPMDVMRNKFARSFLGGKKDMV